MNFTQSHPIFRLINSKIRLTNSKSVVAQYSTELVNTKVIITLLILFHHKRVLHVKAVYHTSYVK
jgi:hypothetical protein